MIAAGVAHEINNPLSFVLSNHDSMRIYFGLIKEILTQYEALEDLYLKGGNIKEAMQKIRELKRSENFDYILSDIESISEETKLGIYRMKEIVYGLKTFSRSDEAEASESDINDCIEVALRVVWNELKYKVTLEKDLKALPKITGFPGQLSQVFANLFVNAAHAIEDKGSLRVRTKCEGDFIEIVVEDTGKGIAAEHLKNIFTPFFTTKSVGRGTGLGLSISYGIIQKHSGTIDVESEVGQGTRFTIRIPTTQSASVGLVPTT
jgi:signal transduction histidine kinase